MEVNSADDRSADVSGSSVEGWPMSKEDRPVAATSVKWWVVGRSTASMNT